jgi:hypothetical protein
MRAGRNRRPSSQSASFDVGILPKRGNLAFKVEGTSKTKPTETKVKGGALIGALVRGAFSGSAKGETTAVGAGVGTMVSAATPGPSVAIPAESQIDFYLASPISVVPVSGKEAARLVQEYRRGGPVLYVRGDTP